MRVLAVGGQCRTMPMLKSGVSHATLAQLTGGCEDSDRIGVTR